MAIHVIGDALQQRNLDSTAGFAVRRGRSRGTPSAFGSVLWAALTGTLVPGGVTSVQPVGTPPPGIGYNVCLPLRAK
ncbi:MAG: hypothetical protein U1E97_11020 [Alphaproteobacteria bacterium]